MIHRNDDKRVLPLSLRLRLIFELGMLAALTPLFLYCAPRDFGLYVGMALLFLGFVAASAKETKERIWRRPTAQSSDRLWRSSLVMAIMTIPGVVIFFAWCASVGHEVSYGNLLLALGAYIPWALLQQTIFQFYLLGRLRALLPLVSPSLLAIVNGMAYGLAHLLDWHVAAVTTIAGIVWSYSYLDDRHVLPIAISHAILGSTFYYFVIGRDLIDEHLAYFSNWLWQRIMVNQNAIGSAYTESELLNIRHHSLLSLRDFDVSPSGKSCSRAWLPLQGPAWADQESDYRRSTAITDGTSAAR